jgi:Zn finger protein HypA/HybF involved in hydrogenase expression
MVNRSVNTASANDVGFEGTPLKPNKIQVSNHPKVCDCKKCNMEYCDCSEEQQGTVAATPEYWQGKK